jgi:hypothetical protein
MRSQDATILERAVVCLPVKPGRLLAVVSQGAWTSATSAESPNRLQGSVVFLNGFLQLSFLGLQRPDNESKPKFFPCVNIPHPL